MLYDKGYTQAKVFALYDFIDSIMVLPEHLEIQYDTEVREYEKEKKMPHITTAERIGIQKCIQQDIMDVLEVRFQVVPEEITLQIQSISDLAELRKLHKQAVVAPDIQEFAKLLDPSSEV
jgi:hypothetical protein